MKLKHFLLTAFILFAGVGGVYAERKYVGFSSVPSGTNYSKAQLKYVLDNANSGDTVFVAAGLYLADTTTAVGELIVPENVTLIGGYAKGDATTLTRRYPGQFVPFKSSVVDTNEFTILDGNSYMRTLPSKKHRVITVNTGGVVDGCLIRNGHIRNGNGGGVLLDGGKLYNSIVRGNVAMSKPDTTIESLGGGVFIQNGGELINCLVAYNMANDGYGVAAGVGGGKMINNTITANTYSPVFAKIPATTEFKLYQKNYSMANRPDDDIILKWPDAISLREFYISRIQTTEGQYAVFCAAMDIPKVISGTDTIGQLNLDVLKTLREPVLNGGTVDDRYKFNGTAPSGVQDILAYNKNDNGPGLRYADGVWYPHLDTASVEYPMANVTWYGALAYAVWLGGGLPTIAQWQFAARCNADGTVSENLYSGAYGSAVPVATDNKDTVTWRILDTIAWAGAAMSIDTTAGDHFGQLGAKWTTRPHEVARKRPNAMGIYDMTGNMMEWIGDRYATSSGFPYKAPLTDPISNSEAGWATRINVGGSYNSVGRIQFSLTYYNYYDVNTVVTFGVRPIVAF